MEQHWITREENRDLIIYALGWGGDYHLVDHIRPDGYDLLCTYDYRTISPVSPESVARYRRIYLFAWSFGVWVSELIFRGITFYRTVALNGTPLPINNRYGIPAKAFTVTLKGMERAGCDTFNRRTFGNSYNRLADWLECRPFAEKYDELQKLYDASTKAYSPTIRWSHAIIGEADVIFPPANVKAYWDDESPATEVQFVPEMPHYPYADPEIVLSQLSADTLSKLRHE